MEKYILITGASSGIGYHMAMQLAGKGYNLILVARSENVLAKMKKELSSQKAVKVEYIVKDLSGEDAATELYEEVKKMNLKVNMLINNAGFGTYGNFTELPLVHELTMIKVNISSVVALTKLFAKEMVNDGFGKIMNVGSLLSFLPFPYYSVYSATKAFIVAFSETIAAELADQGVVVSVLCPGPVETGFNTKEMLNTKAFASNKPVKPEIVAKEGVELLLNGTGKKIVGFGNWFIAQLHRIMPSFLMMKIKKNLASQKS